MSITAQAVQQMTDTGVTPVDVHASLTAQNSIPSGGRIFLRIAASGGGAVNVTVKSQVTVDGQAAPDLVINIPISATKFIGPFPAGVYGKSDGTIEFDIDTPGNVATCYIFQVP